MHASEQGWDTTCNVQRTPTRALDYTSCFLLLLFLFFLKENTVLCFRHMANTKSRRESAVPKKTGVAAHVWITKRHGPTVLHTQEAQSGTQGQVMFRFMSGTGDGCVMVPEDKGG